MKKIEQDSTVDQLPDSDGLASEARLESLKRLRAQLRSQDFGLELESARVMVLALIGLAERYESPKALLAFSREIARQVDALANLALKSQIQREADSIIGRLMDDILTEMDR
jgi:hypothetical protein